MYGTNEMKQLATTVSLMIRSVPDIEVSSTVNPTRETQTLAKVNSTLAPE